MSLNLLAKNKMLNYMKIMSVKIKTKIIDIDLGLLIKL